MKQLIATLALCLSAAVPAFAQDKAQSPAAPAPVEAPALTEVERLKMDRAALLQQVESLVKEVAQWRQMFAQAASRLGEFEVAVQQEQNKAYLDGVIKEIEASRPGFSFDPKSGSFTPKEGKKDK